MPRVCLRILNFLNDDSPFSADRKTRSSRISAIKVDIYGDDTICSTKNK